jgi:hypothetical protein
MNKFEEIVTKNTKLSELKKEGKNLKIVIENTGGGDSEVALFDYEELKEDELEDPHVSKMDTEMETTAQDEDGPEFHVNLDKAPPTLQNTILVRNT